jgi:polyhydroxyalkanoate synthase
MAINAVYEINKKQIGSASECPLVNVLAMCASGTLLLLKLAEIESSLSEKIPIGSITLMAAPFDFRYLEWVQLFAFDSKKSFLNQQKDKNHGESFIPGQLLTQIFCCLRANDLIWPNYVERYLLGKNLSAVDFLYWNNDSLRISNCMFREYVEKFCTNNIFFSKKRETYTKAIRSGLKKIKQQTFIFGAERDYVVPWQSCYAAAMALPNAKFILGGAGHVAGSINPPCLNKYHYYEEDVKRGQSTKDWLRLAKQTSGSWWETWNCWQSPFDSTEIPSCTDFNYFEDAPGSYATMH